MNSNANVTPEPRTGGKAIVIPWLQWFVRTVDRIGEGIG